MYSMLAAVVEAALSANCMNCVKEMAEEAATTTEANNGRNDNDYLRAGRLHHNSGNGYGNGNGLNDG